MTDLPPIEDPEQVMFADGTQLAMITHDLLRGRWLTPLQALDDYRCFRLAAQIHALRKIGWNIHTTLHREGRKVWAEYKLVASPAATRRHNDQKEPT